MTHIARVNIVSGDRIGRIVGKGMVPWKGPVPALGTSNVVMAPLLRTHKAVIDVARVHVLSRDRLWRVDALG